MFGLEELIDNMKNNIFDNLLIIDLLVTISLTSYYMYRSLSHRYDRTGYKNKKSMSRNYLDIKDEEFTKEGKKYRKLYYFSIITGVLIAFILLLIKSLLRLKNL